MARLDFNRTSWEQFVNRNVGSDITGLRRDAIGLYDQLERARRGREVETLMQRANEWLGFHGVEAIAPEGAHVDNYHFNIVATYLNAGDAYSETLLYDTAEHAFYLTSYGDFLEHWERENAPPEEEPEEEPEPPPTWTPKEDEPLVAMLRSIEGVPIAVHYLQPNPFNQPPHPITLAFSLDIFDTDPPEFVASGQRNRFGHPQPYTNTWENLFTAFVTKKAFDVGVCGYGKGPTQGIEREMFQRLYVAMDAFMETGLERQPVKEFLKVPPVLWSCDQVNDIQWITSQPNGRGDREGVQAFVRQHREPGEQIEADDLVVWAAADRELGELMEDGFIKWGDDRTVREYLQHIGVCRAQ